MIVCWFLCFWLNLILHLNLKLFWTWFIYCAYLNYSWFIYCAYLNKSWFILVPTWTSHKQMPTWTSHRIVPTPTSHDSNSWIAYFKTRPLPNNHNYLNNKWKYVHIWNISWNCCGLKYRRFSMQSLTPLWYGPEIACESCIVLFFVILVNYVIIHNKLDLQLLQPKNFFSFPSFMN